jgi:arabinoxylan arabinofuranohydrolase
VQKPESFTKNFNPAARQRDQHYPRRGPAFAGTNGAVCPKIVAAACSKPGDLTSLYSRRGIRLFRHHYTADPAAIGEGRYYCGLYTGHDFAGGQRGYKMKDWLVFSTTDMKNWTEYPVPLKITDFTWATSGDAYAGHVAERNGKVLLVHQHQLDRDRGGG